MMYHPVQPKVGTTVRERDGGDADLMTPADYPVLANCLGCGRPIRIEKFYSPAWEHVMAVVPVRESA